MKLRKIPGEENSSDLGTKYLERVTFEKHRRAAGLRSRGGDDDRGQVNAIAQGSPQNGVEMTLMGMAKCFAGIQAMMQMKGVGAVRNEVNVTAETFVPVILQVILALALAFALGLWHGRTQAETRAREPVVAPLTAGLEVSLADLTAEALRRHLRSVHCSSSGTKAELIVRLQSATRAQRVKVLSVHDGGADRQGYDPVSAPS